MHQVRPQGPLEFNLSPVVRKQLTEVVLGYIGLCDDGAARLGIEWMRDKSRARGETSVFDFLIQFFLVIAPPFRRAGKPRPVAWIRRVGALTVRLVTVGVN